VGAAGVGPPAPPGGLSATNLAAHSSRFRAQKRKTVFDVAARFSAVSVKPSSAQLAPCARAAVPAAWGWTCWAPGPKRPAIPRRSSGLRTIQESESQRKAGGKRVIHQLFGASPTIYFSGSFSRPAKDKDNRRPPW